MAKKRDRLMEAVKRLLDDGLPWPEELDVDTMYEKIQDDADGLDVGKVRVGFLLNGDAWICTDTHRGPALRFRTYHGGGNSVRVRNALVLLALAIKRDNEKGI